MVSGSKDLALTHYDLGAVLFRQDNTSGAERTCRSVHWRLGFPEKAKSLAAERAPAP